MSRNQKSVNRDIKYKYIYIRYEQHSNLFLLNFISFYFIDKLYMVLGLLHKM